MSKIIFLRSKLLHQPRLLSTWLFSRTLSLIVCLTLSVYSTSHAQINNKFSEQRLAYTAALQQLQDGKIEEFNASLQQLKDYVLFPYLEFAQLDHQLRHLPNQEVQHFIEKYRGTPISRKMTYRWLNQLVKNHQWQLFVDSWDPSITNSQLNCWYLRALYRTDHKAEALAAVQPLWLKPSSQPKACDPLFKEWIEAGYLTQELAWQRLSLAMDARRYRLASYIVRKLLINEYHELGTEYMAAHRRPGSIIENTKVLGFPEHRDKSQQIIVHGLKRLARKDLASSRAQWEQYRTKLPFTEQQQLAIHKALVIAAAMKEDPSDLDSQLLEGDADDTPEAIELRIRKALRKADWEKVSFWINLLPSEHQNQHRWRYWQARSMQELGIDRRDQPSPKQIYSELSKNRSFYGFLSADLISSDYAMQDKPAPITAETMNSLKNNSAIIRALELFAVNQINDARSEWYAGSRNFDAQLLTSAGKLAEQFGWHSKAIESYIQAKYWNDLQARFPLAYKSNMAKASESNQIEMTWLYAIARQESAFAPDAKSSAGALGLMQLMPSTAKQTANQIGLKFKTSDLLKPDTNIHLGSNYLKSLLTEFNGNRILATTAYNAGPYRVKRWLEATKSNLPFDAWIETIPYKETRAYVQNVLAFSVIYGYRMDSVKQLVTSLEARQTL